MNQINKYSLIIQIAKGGFSTTFLAQDENNNKYAIKKINIDKGDLRLLNIIEKEIDFMKNVSHPNIPTLIESYKIVEDGFIEINIVQEFIDGDNLYQMIKNGKSFNQNEVIKILLQVCNILEFIHNFNPSVIHRDIKPSNIMIDKNGKVFLIDFGSIKEKITFEYTSKSGLSTIIGTQGYMPIEQFEGKANLSSDIYSLGLTAIYLLSKKEPLQLPRENLKVIFENHVNVTQSFSNILSKMIDPDYTKRYKYINSLKKDLNNINSKSIILQNNLGLVNYLEPKEEILMKKNPKLSFILRRNNVVSLLTLGLLLFVGSNIGFMIFLYLVTKGSLTLEVLSVLFTFSLIELLFAFALSGMPFIAYKYSRQTNYLLTDKRLMIIPMIKKKKPTFFNLPIRIIRAIAQSRIVLHDSKKILLELPTILIRILEFNNNPDEIKRITDYFEEVRYINYEDLKNFYIERIEYKDGSGDLNFYYLKDGKKEAYLKLISISDVKNVEKMIMNQIKESEK